MVTCPMPPASAAVSAAPGPVGTIVMSPKYVLPIAFVTVPLMPGTSVSVTVDVCHSRSEYEGGDIDEDQPEA